MHTVRTQLEYFSTRGPTAVGLLQRVCPRSTRDGRRSDIVTGRLYDEQQMCSTVVECVSPLDLHGATLVGEFLGDALRCRHRSTSKTNQAWGGIQPYDYPSGLERGTGSPGSSSPVCDHRFWARFSPVLSPGRGDRHQPSMGWAR